MTSPTIPSRRLPPQKLIPVQNSRFPIVKKYAMEDVKSASVLKVRNPVAYSSSLGCESRTASSSAARTSLDESKHACADEPISPRWEFECDGQVTDAALQSYGTAFRDRDRKIFVMGSWHRVTKLGFKYAKALIIANGGIVTGTTISEQNNAQDFNVTKARAGLPSEFIQMTEVIMGPGGGSKLI